MPASTPVALTSPDEGSPGPSSPNGGTLPTDCEVTTLARHIRDRSGQGDDRKSLSQWISKLRDEQAAQRAERKRVAMQLKNTLKRKRRLQNRARQLTNADLMEVLLMRETERPTATPAAAGSTEVVGDEDDAASETSEQPVMEKKKDTGNTSDDATPQSSPGAASSSRPQ